jgi:5,6,7,8-tetrahydromethanopterin hydro-lyase
VPVKPFTLFVNKARIEGEHHAELTWGAAQAGVAAGVADAVHDGLLSAEEADSLVLIAAVWVDPAAADPELVFVNNRAATRGAIELGRAGLPAAADVAGTRDDIWNPFYRPV